VKRIVACQLVMLFVSCPVAAANPTPEHWQPVARLIGTWSGISTGSAGEEINTSVDIPREKNNSGEVHAHWGIFSYDKQRETLMLGQFHAESFVYTYRRVYSRTQLRRTSR
jgi:hypothetical protein